MTQDRLAQHLEDILARAERLVDGFDVLSVIVVPGADEFVQLFGTQLKRLADHVEGLRADLELA